VARRPAFGDSTISANSGGGFAGALKWIIIGALVIGAGVFGFKAWQHFGQRPRDEVFVPEHAVNLDKVDLVDVHHELLGRWALRSEHKFEMRNAEARIAAADKALRKALAPDANLTAIFDELAGLVAEGKLRNDTKRERALWLTRAWNQYLDANDRPYFLKAFVAYDPNPEFHLYAYEVVAETTATLSGSQERVRFISRLDEVNRGEWYHASTPTEGAVVRVDWTVQFALDHIWPLFGAPDPKYPRRKLFGPEVVAEAKAALPASVVATLEATADARAAGVRAHAEIRERQGCSGFWLGRQPWDGFDGDALQELSNNIGSGKCPSVYRSEFNALDQARTTLSETEALEPAVQALVAWVVRARVIHEVRHVGAGIDLYNLGTDVQCTVCAKDLKNPERAEVAALIAEWAWTDSPATTLFRQCTDDEAQLYGPVATAFKALDWSCSKGPHPNLVAAAQTLEQEVFGASDSVEVSDAITAPLPLDRSVVHRRESLP